MELCKWVELDENDVLHIQLRNCAKAREILREWASGLDSAVGNAASGRLASRLLNKLDEYDALSDPQGAW